MLDAPCGIVAGFAPKFCKSRITRVVGVSKLVGCSLDVSPPNYACNSCSSKVAI
jgi:hypothetical protein